MAATDGSGLRPAFLPLLPQDPALEDAHFKQMELQGFTLVPDVLPLPLLQACRDYLDDAVAEHQRQPDASEESEVGAFLNPADNPLFASLFDNPGVLPLVQRAMRERTRCPAWPDGESATLLDMNDAHFMPAGCGDTFFQRKRMGWHPDGEYVRLTYLLDDLDPDGGGTAFYPGSHRDHTMDPTNPRASNANPSTAGGGVGGAVPEFFNVQPGRVPVESPGTWRAAGPAGSCIVNYTMTWHTRTPNRSDKPRQIIWLVYKRASEPQPNRYREGKAQQGEIQTEEQADGLGRGETRSTWAPYVTGLAAGDPKRRLCGFDMADGVEFDWRKEAGAWVTLEPVTATPPAPKL
jgi:hypothetical protein